MGEFAHSAKPELLAALADVGVQPDDYELIEEARALVDRVNRRLRRRGSRMVYTITFCNAVPLFEADIPISLDAPSDQRELRRQGSEARKPA